MRYAPHFIVTLLLAPGTLFSVTISFQPVQGTALVGTNFAVDVVASGLTGGSAIGSFDFGITYPTRLLSPTGVTFLNYLGTAGDQITISNLGAPGLIGVSEVSLEAPETLRALQTVDSVSLLRLFFDAKETGVAELNFSSSPFIISDELGEILPAQTAKGSVIISNPPQPSDDIGLFQWLFTVDGSISDSQGIEGPAILPPFVDSSAFDFASGLGMIQIPFNTPGAHDFVAFFDHEIMESTNGFSNESGRSFNPSARPAGLAWEIGEPGYVTPPPNIFTNALANSLSNENAIASPLTNDMSMAVGWSFVLTVGESADLRLTLSTSVPTSGFYLEQFDPGANRPLSIYLSTSLDRQATPIPEPASVITCFCGLLCVCVLAVVRSSTSKNLSHNGGARLQRDTSG